MIRFVDIRNQGIGSRFAFIALSQISLLKLMESKHGIIGLSLWRLLPMTLELIDLKVLLMSGCLTV